LDKVASDLAEMPSISGSVQIPSVNNDKGQLTNLQNSFGNNLFDHQNRRTNDRDVEKMKTQFGANVKDNITRLPQKPRCNPTQPRGLSPTGPRQSEPKCAASDPSQYKYDIRRVICLSRYFFIAQRNGITPSKGEFKIICAEK